MKDMLKSNSLLGLAVGDALGEPVESYSQWQIEAEYGKITDFVKEPMITDDTLFAMLVAESIIEKRKVVGKHIAIKFVENRHKFYRIGPTTSKALERLEKNPKSKATTGETNGAAMRVAPIGLINDDLHETVRDTIEASIITHGTDVAIAAACAVACAVSTALEAENKDEVLEAAIFGGNEGLKYGTKTKFPAIDERIKKALKTPLELLPQEIGVWMKAYESIPTAIAIFYHSQNSEEAIVNAVNLGGDTDTIGAIVGAISGAYYKEIPKEWTIRIKERQHLQFLEKKLLEIRKTKR